MKLPMEWSTRGLCRRDAERALELAERLLRKVDRHSPRAVACRVAVERDAWRAMEREVEGPVRVRVELTIPSRPPLVAVRRADEGWPGEAIDPALHEAFRRILGQLGTASTKVASRMSARRSGARWAAIGPSGVEP